MVASSARKYRPARNASAKLMPSAEIPKPENIRRIVTGPKSENRSIRKSRSMLPHSSLDRGREGFWPPLPPNRTGGFPAYGSPVAGFLIVNVSRVQALLQG